MTKKQIFLYAFKKSIPVLLGYLFLGMAFGILIQDTGLSWPWALLCSGLIYAGSMQFALVSLLTAGASLPSIALMTLMVNSRHLFYGLSFVEKFRKMGKKYPYMIFSLTDETYSVLCSCEKDSISAEQNHLAYFYLSALHQIYWAAGSVLGAIAGELIAFDTSGIEFSMTALFVVILVDQLRTGNREARCCAAMGMGLSLCFLLILGADKFLLPTLGCVVLILALVNARKGAARVE